MRQLWAFLMLLAMFSCEKENEVVPIEQPQGRLLIKTEYRTSYGHIQADSFVYDQSGLRKRIFYYQGDYNSEKLFIHKDNVIQMFVNNGGVMDPEFTELQFDQEKKLNKKVTKSCCEYDVVSEIIFEYQTGSKPSGANGWVNSVYTFDAAGNLKTNRFFTAGSNYEVVMTYDDKINPYKQLPYYELDFRYFSENNVLNYKEYKDGKLLQELLFDYAYDAAGYPIKMVSDRDTTYYYYR